MKQVVIQAVSSKITWRDNEKLWMGIKKEEEERCTPIRIVLAVKFILNDRSGWSVAGNTQMPKLMILNFSIL